MKFWATVSHSGKIAAPQPMRMESFMKVVRMEMVRKTSEGATRKKAKALNVVEKAPTMRTPRKVGRFFGRVG